MKIPKPLADLLNKQINHELEAYYAYLAMAAWSESEDYPGIATWMKNQAQEELFHMMKIFDFLAEAGVTMKMMPLAAPQNKFKSVESDLAKAQRKLERGISDNQSKLVYAEKKAGEMREKYVQAVKANAFPVVVGEAAYSKDKLVQQVKIFLTQIKGYKEILTAYERTKKAASSAMERISNRINMTQAKLEMLSAKKELVKIQKLTAETETLMADVNDLLEENAREIEETKVLTVEEMMKREMGETGSGTPGAADSDVMKFLEVGAEAPAAGKT